ncbi:MAG: hypothetical protein P0Y64_12015 [Candidatus Sphingomonas colombiensis]|nr:hypothetical protein [Sphingomonas sp.]WEK42116.1 MAG: hypothetical protein P0Y64_12015 [Sphingomonas sp.]
MTNSMSPNVRALSIAVAVTLGSFGGSATALAQSATPISASAPAAVQPVPPSDGDVRRLTDEQRNAILDANTVESAALARGEQPMSGALDRRVHGEVGFMIGTNGARGAYGTADIPLGDNAGATVSFESSRFGPRR